MNQYIPGGSFTFLLRIVGRFMKRNDHFSIGSKPKPKHYPYLIFLLD